MSKKKTLTAVFVILICILIGGVLLRQYKRANTTECILKGTITSIEDNVFTVVPDTSNLNAMGPTYLTHADSLSFRPNGKTKVYGRYGMTEVDISELHVGDYVQVRFHAPIHGEYDGRVFTMDEIKYQIKVHKQRSCRETQHDRCNLSINWSDLIILFSRRPRRTARPCRDRCARRWWCRRSLSRPCR